MTAVSLAVQVRRENVFHFLGYGGQHAPGPRIEEVLGAVLEEARTLADPRGLWRLCPPECAGMLGLQIRPGGRLVLGLVTIGPDLEQRVSSLIANGEATRALLLDAAGSAATEEAAGEMERCIHGGRTSRRFSPGYGSWPITAQRALFELLPHDEIRVRLLPSCLMTPRKSVSFALWLGEEHATPAGEEDQPARCETCGLVSCPYRHRPPAPAEVSPTPEES